MKKSDCCSFLGTFFLVSLFYLLSTQSVMAQNQIPLEDFFRNPEKTGYQISPDGKFYSYLAPYENRLNIFVQQIGKEKSIRLIGSNSDGFPFINPFLKHIEAQI
jgi:hypothetical protein